jgi:hypothetical protein
MYGKGDHERYAVTPKLLKLKAVLLSLRVGHELVPQAANGH